MCGFALSRTIAYVVNTDINSRYNVTICINWQLGIDSSSSDQIVMVNARVRVRLGCTVSQYILVTTLTYNVVGEAHL